MPFIPHQKFSNYPSDVPHQKDKSKTIRLSCAHAMIRFFSKQTRQDPDKELRSIIWAFANLTSHQLIDDALFQERKQMTSLPHLKEKTLCDLGFSFTRLHSKGKFIAIHTYLHPQGLNFLAPMLYAKEKRLPILFIFSQKGDKKKVSPIKDSCKYTVEINDHRDLILALPQAINTLTHPTQKGPVSLIIREELLGEFHDFPSLFFTKKKHTETVPAPKEKDLEKLLEKLCKSQAPLIISGGGVHLSQASQELSLICKSHKIPILETFSGKGSLSWNTPLHLGALTKNIPCLSQEISMLVDFVLCIGTYLDDLDDKTNFFQNKNIQYACINPIENATTNFPFFTLFADAKKTLQELSLSLGNYCTCSKYQNVVGQYVDLIKSQYIQKTIHSDGAILAPQAIAIINHSLRPHDLVVCTQEDFTEDVHAFWHASHHRRYFMEYDRHWMGYQEELALGIKASFPHQEVYIITGPKYYLHMQELLLASKSLRLCLHLIIFDHTYLIEAPSFPKIDYAMHTESLGFKTIIAQDLDQLSSYLQKPRKDKESYAYIIKTESYKPHPHEAFWKASLDKRFHVQKTTKVNYKSEEAIWHARFPWELEKEKEKIIEVNHDKNH